MLVCLNLADIFFDVQIKKPHSDLAFYGMSFGFYYGHGGRHYKAFGQRLVYY